MLFRLRNIGAPHECKSTWSFSSILEYCHVRTPVLPFLLFEHYQMHKRIYLILKIFISISTLSPWLTSKKTIPIPNLWKVRNFTLSHLIMILRKLNGFYPIFLIKKSFIKITSAYYCSIFINYFQTRPLFL